MLARLSPLVIAFFVVGIAAAINDCVGIPPPCIPDAHDVGR